ncbi:dimethylamine monooxygenase subunit DmmA family protein [Pseudomonas sp. GL-RE-19]|uniref:dimethylamine monooxygenase subunit DmmA family protein n=1 Tax=Pseudomonas sp. GL-RE-19 TaxID=2832389 RepID=UPI001CBABBE2|nr:dimethylamine monooxygenase subunit DmmA family protein [Pseudomonas sp. GL-RE-19]
MADSNVCPHAPFKSVPLYSPVVFNRYATRHVFVSDGTDSDVRDRMILEVGAETDLISLSIGSPAIADKNELHQALFNLLRDARIGIHLYLFGDESFIWTLHALAVAQGLSNEEITLGHSGSRTHQLIYCVHCADLQTQPVGHTLTCQNCGVELEVRAHFSRRLGAYLGVCLNADEPYGRDVA